MASIVKINDVIYHLVNAVHQKFLYLQVFVDILEGNITHMIE